MKCTIPNCPLHAAKLPPDDFLGKLQRLQRAADEVRSPIKIDLGIKRRFLEGMPWQVALKRFGLFFLMQFVAYGLVTWNFRAISKGWIGNVVLSDLLIAAVGFSLISKVAEAKDHPARFGYIAGGAAGSAFSVLLTKFVWGS